jgi:hypothetical protein
MPTAEFAKTFVKTRVDPVIASSPALKYALNVNADNTTMKQLGDAFAYFKGTVGTSAAISIPADGIVNDELDFSDLEVTSNYQSRLTHSPYKLKRKFSTPTVSGYGISAEFDASRRYFNFVKCNHCNHAFLPDYFTDVVIPGFFGDKREINKENVQHMKYREAYVACPKCGKAPSLQPEHREWVLENPDANFIASGYQIQPFDAPNIISMSDLILASTTYRRYVDFINFGLGLPAEDKDSTLSREEIEACVIEALAANFFTHVMGVDMGMICHVMIAGVDSLGQIITVHTERIPLSNLRVRLAELRVAFRVSITVMDSQPYTETLMSLQEKDDNLYGAVYVKSRDLAPYALKKQEGKKAKGSDLAVDDKDVGKAEIRQVNVNHDKAMDALMTFIRGGSWRCVKDKNWETVMSHFQDMKRVKDFTSDNELAFVWKKSAKGDDHFWHTALYTYIAAQLRGVASGQIVLPSLTFKFRQKSPTA